MSYRLFDFVRQFSTDLADLAGKIEDQLFEQAHATLIQARLYTEELVKIISQKEELEKVYPLKPAERIHKLYRQDIINEEIYSKLEWIRKMGNKAAHNVQEIETKDVLEAHKQLFEISVWYMQVYVSYDFEAPAYKLPIQTNPSPISKEDLDDRIREEVQRQMGAIKLENERTNHSVEDSAAKAQVENQQKAPRQTREGVIHPLSKEKESFCRVFDENNYFISYETRKAVEFKHKLSYEMVYMLDNKETSIVLNPVFVEKHEELKSTGKLRSSTALRQFPKEKNKGDNPISYGYMYVFKTESELDSFLKSLQDISKVSI
ncbi:DUF4145 domain-containing protein [Neobacillus kokaensis]|uniref:DUF4145 domain-containing protein n=1 Tax=Neobacillus kokaensis TaxID=2759023 RepID=A0ABQ3N510_9BACI|nr:DUF4145 domain-containing protein [Neobacillus kokaensis]GHH99186.1 hypothetical protein AM1BK_27290 [Neobacillus kokaensis]